MSNTTKHASIIPDIRWVSVFFPEDVQASMLKSHYHCSLILERIKNRVPEESVFVQYQIDVPTYRSVIDQVPIGMQRIIEEFTHVFHEVVKYFLKPYSRRCYGYDSAQIPGQWSSQGITYSGLGWISPSKEKKNANNDCPHDQA